MPRHGLKASSAQTLSTEGACGNTSFWKQQGQEAHGGLNPPPVSLLGRETLLPASTLGRLHAEPKGRRTSGYVYPAPASWLHVCYGRRRQEGSALQGQEEPPETSVILLIL